jgi:dihydrofolate reductase
MKVIMANAVSINGMIAREDGGEDWLPDSGWKDFLASARHFGNFVMGRDTYETVMRLYPDYNFDDVETQFKIIVTRDASFKAEGYITADSPQAAVAYVKAQGLDTVLLVGGGKLNASFLKHGLVDEIWLTITPHLLGQGRPVVDGRDIDVPLSLIETKQLDGGRILAKYAVRKTI